MPSLVIGGALKRKGGVKGWKTVLPSVYAHTFVLAFSISVGVFFWKLQVLLRTHSWYLISVMVEPCRHRKELAGKHPDSYGVFLLRLCNVRFTFYPTTILNIWFFPNQSLPQRPLISALGEFDGSGLLLPG